MRQIQTAIVLKEGNGHPSDDTVRRKGSKPRIADLPQVFVELGQSALLIAKEKSLLFAKKKSLLIATEETLKQLPTLDEICCEYMQRVLDLCGGNAVHAARILGIGRTTIYRYQ